MRSKLCEDGKNRILAKVAVPMGTMEIVTYAMANPRFLDKTAMTAVLDEHAMNDFENLNKRQLFNVAKETVALTGVDFEAARNRAAAVWTPKQMQRATEHVVRLFPEVD